MVTRTWNGQNISHIRTWCQKDGWYYQAGESGTRTGPFNTEAQALDAATRTY